MGENIMTEYIAKPNLNTDIGKKTFSTESEAILYLEEYTGYSMSFEKNKKTGEKTSDWYLIDKLMKVQNE
jgi:hypothetical protein|tara:strand:+ start:124 stop:333 length:210 start_codon:yes stop_codon:yes gene_type:complete